MSGVELRRCHACAGAMAIDDVTRIGDVAIGTTFVCGSCASTALVLSPVGYGFLYGSAAVCVIAAVAVALSKEPRGPLVAIFSLGLAAFFGFLAYLRLRDERQNPPM